jgi:hypothetical protein
MKNFLFVLTLLFSLSSFPQSTVDSLFSEELLLWAFFITRAMGFLPMGT